MPADPNRVRDLFLAAADLPSIERTAYLIESCGADADLRAAVERLLAAHANPASVLEPAGDLGGPIAALPLSVTDPHTPQPDAGTVLAGRYKLLEPIGEGGMGAVWTARQTEPVKRMVAVKLIKPGMDSKAVLARFEAERQALALMEHPNIARVFDAGATPDGRPFFVMELVKGVPITQFCDARKLTPRERLELFIPVCQAIQHAHQKGIIHRDIKPSNVLVALYDDRAVPKVIDFGVAKATGQPLTDETFHTGFGTVIGTPQYMSPEQAMFNNLDVDTRSDLYSLGVLLYELLAGSPPFTKKDLEQAGMLEMLRVVREVEPQRPSTKLSTADALPTLAANRNTEPKKLTGMLRNELDWIVMKALEKDRTRRYETANGFAADVQRYLCGESVLAVPPSVGYRLRKSVRRHKKGVLAAAVVVTALVGGLIGITYGMIEAGNQKVATVLRMKAERDRDSEAVSKAEQARQGITTGLTLSSDLRKEYRFTEARAALAQVEQLARAGAPERLSEVEQVQRDLSFVVSLDYIRYRKWMWIAHEGGGGHFNSDIAPPEYRKAFAERGLDLISLDPFEAAKRIAASEVEIDLVAAVDDWALYEPDKGVRNRLLEIARRADPGPWTDRLRTPTIRGDGPALEKLAAEAAAASPPPVALSVLAELMRRNGLTPVALLSVARANHPKDFELAFALGSSFAVGKEPWRRIGPYEAARALRPDLYAVWSNLGWALCDSGDVDRAVAEFKQAITLDPRSSQAHYDLGLMMERKKNVDEAITCFRESIRLDRTYAPPYTNLGWNLRQKGELGEAIANHKEAIRLDPKFARAYNDLGVALREKGELYQAAVCFHEAIHLDPQYSAAQDNLRQTGNGFANRDVDLDGAISAHRRAITIDPQSVVSHAGLGQLFIQWANERRTETEYRAALTTVEDLAAKFPERLRYRFNVSWIHTRIGDLFIDQGRKAEGMAEYRLAREIVDELVAKDLRQQSYRAELSKIRLRMGESDVDWRDQVPGCHSYGISFSPAGDYFLTCGERGSCSPVHVYRARNGELLRTFLPDEDIGWSTAAFSPDGSKVVHGGKFSPKIYLWDVATGRMLFKLDGHESNLTSVIFSPNGKLFVSGSYDGTLRVWNASTGELLHVLRGHGNISQGYFSPDNKWIVSYSTDKTVRVWDAASGSEIWKREGQSPSFTLAIYRVREMCFSEDSSQVVSYAGDGGLQVWETATGKPIACLTCKSGFHGAMFVRGGGKRLVAWDRDKTLHVFDLPSGKLVNKLDLGKDLLNQSDNVAVSPDGRFVLTGHANQVVKLHNLASGTIIKQYHLEPKTDSRGLTFSPDLRQAAAGSLRGWVYLWDLRRQENP